MLDIFLLFSDVLGYLADGRTQMSGECNIFRIQ